MIIIVNLYSYFIIVIIDLIISIKINVKYGI